MAPAVGRGSQTSLFLYVVSTLMCMSTMTVSEAHAALPEIVDRVLAGEEVTLTRHGVAVAIVVRPDALKVRRAGRALAASVGVHDVLTRGGRSPLSAQPTLTPERADLLVAGVRVSRCRR